MNILEIREDILNLEVEINEIVEIFKGEELRKIIKSVEDTYLFITKANVSVSDDFKKEVLFNFLQDATEYNVVFNNVFVLYNNIMKSRKFNSIAIKVGTVLNSLDFKGISDIDIITSELQFSLKNVKELIEIVTDNKTSKLEGLANKIANLLDGYDCNSDVAIYFEGKRLSTFGDGWKLEEGVLGSEFCEYSNDKTITMTYEGDFYRVLNDGLFPKLEKEFSDLLEEYNYYYEMGYAWSLALYEI